MNNIIAHKDPFRYYTVDDHIPTEIFNSFQKVCEKIPDFTYPIPYFKSNWFIFWSKNKGCFLRTSLVQSNLKHGNSEFAKLNKPRVRFSGTKFEHLQFSLGQYITLQHHGIEDLIYKNLNDFAEYSFDINLDVTNKFNREYSSVNDLFLICEFQVLNLHAENQTHHHSNRLVSSVTYLYPKESNGTDFHLGNYDYNNIDLHFDDIPINYVVPWKQNRSLFFTDELHSFRAIESEKRITINNWLIDGNSDYGKSLMKKFT